MPYATAGVVEAEGSAAEDPAAAEVPVEELIWPSLKPLPLRLVTVPACPDVAAGTAAAVTEAAAEALELGLAKFEDLPREKLP